MPKKRRTQGLPLCNPFRWIRITNLFGFIALVAFSFTMHSCSREESHPEFGSIQKGYITFKHGGLERQYALHVPHNVGENAPLLISMHGYTDDAKRHCRYTELNRVADENGFIVAYPRGIKDQERKRFFNMGYFFHQEETVDDVGFITELVLHLQEKFKTDPERTFTSGFSNGGDMSYMLHCQRPDLFKGFVSVGGLMLEDFKENCDFSVPIPVFEIRGEDDEITMYDGDIDNETGWGHYPPIEETIEFWKERNGCTSVFRDTLFNPNSRKDCHVIITKYQDCDSGKEVWLYKVTNYGHQWPQGTDNLFFNASEELWKFLKQY